MERTVSTRTATRRVIYVCGKCKAARTVDHEMEITEIWYQGRCTRTTRYTEGSEYAVSSKYGRCACGGYTKANTVLGRVTDHKCDGKCLNAKNSACECACGGANHGSNHIAA